MSFMPASLSGGRGDVVSPGTAIRIRQGEQGTPPAAASGCVL